MSADRDQRAALPYLRSIVCNLTRNRHRHLRVVRQRTPAGVDESSSEQAAILAEDHREVIAALAKLPVRRREAIVLRYWLDLPEREIAAAMGVSPGTVKSQISRAGRARRNPEIAEGPGGTGMNTLEDRLRDALHAHAHAEDFTAHPDAWQQLRSKSRAGGNSWLARTVARSQRRPGRALVWSRFVVPAAAAAAVIAIILGAIALTGSGSPRGGSGAQPASPAAAGVPAPPGRSDYLIQQDPPVSAVVQVKMTVAGRVAWVSVWFSHMKGNSGRTVLCTEIAITGDPADGFCEPAQIPAGHTAVPTTTSGVIEMGVASVQVASVSAQWPGGHGSGKLVWSRGFPAKVWLLRYPIQESSQIVFRSAAGLKVGKLIIFGAQPLASRPRSGGVTVARYPAGFLGPKPGMITGYLVGGQIGFWASGNSLVGYSPVLVSEPAGLSVFIVRAEVPSQSKLVEFYGYAPENAVRVTMRLADGRQFSARPIGGRLGNVRLWALSVPGGVSSMVRYVALGYNASNQVVSQLTVSSPG